MSAVDQMKASADINLAMALGSEDAVREHVRREMEARGWSQSELARHLKDRDATTKLTQPVISRIIATSRAKQRDITIGDAIELAEVFDMNLGSIVLDPDLLEAKAWISLLQDALSAREAMHAAERHYSLTVRDLADASRDHPRLLAAVRMTVDQRLGDVEDVAPSSRDATTLLVLSDVEKAMESGGGDVDA